MTCWAFWSTSRSPTCFCRPGEPVRGAGATREPGLILRPVKLGDSSKIVSALTERFGRVKLVAKGSRQLGSRLSALLEPGNELDLVSGVLRVFFGPCLVGARQKGLDYQNIHITATSVLSDRPAPQPHVRAV